MVTPPPAGRLADVLAPVIPLVGTLVRQYPGTLSLAQGMVAWGPPAAVSSELRQVLAEGEREPSALSDLHRYGPGLGDPRLLAAVRRELRDVRRIDLEGTEVMVTAGSNMAFHAIAAVICDRGDEVILPLPWYFNHAMAIQLAGGVPVGVDAGLVLDPGRLAAAITPRTRAIVTISPNNPSGVIQPPEVLERINALCERSGIFHISDEAYAEFVHGAIPHYSPGQAPGSGGHTMSLYSLSKAYGMAGWRIGYAAVPAHLTEALLKVQDTVLICPPRWPQLAARAALEAGPAWCRGRVSDLRPRRDQLIAAVASARGRGLDIALMARPDGAFYGLVDVASPLPGEELVAHLIREKGVAALPGESFGLRPAPGRAVLRLSYGMLDGADLAAALDRLMGGLADLSRRGEG
jgi:aspartate/methionine/tyrosine aminotransferase